MCGQESDDGDRGVVEEKERNSGAEWLLINAK